MDYHAIGRRIRKFRLAQNLSQEALAEMVNISTTHMSHIETGSTKLSLPVLVSIADALMVRTDDLLCDVVSAAHSVRLENLAKLLDGCTPRELNILEDILVAAKDALKRNL